MFAVPSSAGRALRALGFAALAAGRIRGLGRLRRPQVIMPLV
jgi:hypothetical protein